MPEYRERFIYNISPWWKHFNPMIETNATHTHTDAYVRQQASMSYQNYTRQ